MKIQTIFIIASIYFSGIALADRHDCNSDLEIYLKCNNTIVQKFLSSLSEKDVGKNVSGIKLTDNNEILKNYIYIGKSKRTHKYTHLYFFKKNNKYIGYVWIETGGKQLLVPTDCEQAYIEAALVLSGDVYTLRYVQSDDGVINLVCVTKSWIEEHK
jgi:hypothetical protein